MISATVGLDERTHDMRVQDGSRFLEFEGRLIGESTSDIDGAQRWTEVKIYATDTGRYVVSKVGVSAVYHTDNEMCGHDAKPLPVSAVRAGDSVFVPIVELIPCRRCQPEELEDYDNDATIVRVEQPRYSAHVSDTAAGLVEALHRRDGSGVVYLPNVARRAIEEAAAEDSLVRAAWQVQKI